MPELLAVLEQWITETTQRERYDAAEVRDRLLDIYARLIATPVAADHE